MIKRVCWLTDTHLNVLAAAARQAFYQTVVEQQCDAIIITGDISETPSTTAQMLQEMHASIRSPIYFVLGNHDYFSSTVELAHKQMRLLHKQNSALVWLPLYEYIPLTKTHALLGQDGWADARLGNFAIPDENDLDAQNIHDLIEAKRTSRAALQKKMQHLADRDASQLQHQIEQAIHDGYQKLTVVTHIPPYAEVAWHRDKPYDEVKLPYFTSDAIATVLNKSSKKYPEVTFRVLCGHTHTARKAQITTNLSVNVGYAKTGSPKVVAILQDFG
jgi:predicted phosphodiesterase